IKSPINDKLVKVFSKKFNDLLNDYSLDELLSLPRQIKGDKKIGVAFNNIVTLQQQCDKLKNTYYSINKLIERSPIVGIYVNAILQINNYDGVYFNCAIFKNGQLIEYFEMKEYIEDFIYTNKVNKVDHIKNFDQYVAFLQEDNENKLVDIKIDSLSINQLDRKEALLKLNNSTFSNNLFSICKHHVWLSSNSKILNLLPSDYVQKTSFTLLDEETNNRNYEHYEEVKEKKIKLIDEINDIKNQLILTINK